MTNKINPHQVAENVFAFSGTEVNWVLIHEGTELTLVDAGWDSDIQEVERSIRSLGRRPEDVRAVLLTHAHADHTGALNHMHDNYGVPLYMDALEVPNARGETTESGGPMDVIKHAYRPQVVRWAAQMVKAGALKRFTFPSALPFPKEGPLDIPGRPVPVATHGHTSGHSSFFLPDVGVLLSGDALVTAHPLFSGGGPRLLPGDFSHNQRDAIHALDAFRALDADVFIPGHGQPCSDPSVTPSTVRLSAQPPVGDPMTTADGSRAAGFTRGMEVINAINGGSLTALADSLADISPELGYQIVSWAFGDIYSRPALPPRDRQLLTLAMLTALGGCEANCGCISPWRSTSACVPKRSSKYSCSPLSTADSPRLSTRHSRRRRCSRNADYSKTRPEPGRRLASAPCPRRTKPTAGWAVSSAGRDTCASG
jgi:glyoxylase-like metal-dependent hydrolase (beta-lactamase superfamily II)